ncbi:hypothetical protein COV19_02215 [Candidatus Woesearchaeota archaeon CG10_big_fil_rev_8_21_14_0_10_44_13]|nr:MAG: hypothetical protein COV19_02215 [Candidatus Woesearchaeota archaeon CG10_big_fil_rev_8_21_14_0_10_44_13]
MPEHNKKSQIWESAVLYVLMTAIIMVIVLEAGVPILQEMRDKAVFIQTRDNFISLNQHIEDVSNAGPGSQRLVPIQIKKGYLKIDNEKIKWYMDTKADVIEPMSKISTGNVKMASDSDVDAYESGNYLIIENFYAQAGFNKIGNESSFGNITSTNILDYMKFKGTGSVANGTFTLQIDGTSFEGNGYTKIDEEGYDKDRAVVRAFINTTSGANYTVTFTMYGDTDFMTVNIE